MHFGRLVHSWVIMTTLYFEGAYGSCEEATTVGSKRNETFVKTEIDCMKRCYCFQLYMSQDLFIAHGDWYVCNRWHSVAIKSYFFYMQPRFFGPTDTVVFMQFDVALHHQAMCMVDRETADQTTTTCKLRLMKQDQFFVYFLINDTSRLYLSKEQQNSFFACCHELIESLSLCWWVTLFPLS